MPTYIYPAQEDFYSYAINQYNSTNNMTTSGYCSLTDQQCALLNEPLYNRVNESVSTCLDDPFTASGCCSLQSEAYFANSSRKAETDWTVRLSDVIEGTVSRRFGHRIILGIVAIPLFRVHSVSVDCFLVTIRI